LTEPAKAELNSNETISMSSISSSSSDGSSLILESDDEFDVDSVLSCGIFHRGSTEIENESNEEITTHTNTIEIFHQSSITTVNPSSYSLSLASLLSYV
jgi:hypothetical protein